MNLIKVAAGVVNQTPLDWRNNKANILTAIAEARRQHATLLCLPEMCITGYGCEDAFHSPGVWRTAWAVMREIVPETNGMIVSLGLPVYYQHSAYNAACLVADGRILGFTAKRFLAGDGIHYEPRWFKPWPPGIRVALAADGEEYPLGDLFFEVGGVRIGFEICEDAWVANRPGSQLALWGVDVILNPSASHFAFGKKEIRRRFVLEGSRAFGVSYIYANLLGNEAGRAIYDGGPMIASGGKLIAEGPRFSFEDVQVTSAVIDLDLTRMGQARIFSYSPQLNPNREGCVHAEFAFPEIEPELPGTTGGPDPDTIFASLEQTIESAARKQFGDQCALEVTIDRTSGQPAVRRDGEDLPAAEVAELLGHVAASGAKQRMIEKIRQAERDAILHETGEVERLAWETSEHIKEEEFARAVSLALFDYMRKSRSRGFVVSISGGADSAAVACLVWLMVRLGVKELGRERFLEKLGYMAPQLQSARDERGLVRALLTTAYQATANSGEITRNAARGVAEAIGAEHLEFNVEAIVQQYVATISSALGRKLTWEQDDLALQNIQARVRAPGVWMLANIKGALLLSTSNRSEAAVGYATMDGDTSGGVSPIAGIDKAFLRQWLRWLEREGPDGLDVPALDAVNCQQPTAELRPTDAGQTDEADLMPYPLLDAIERLAIRDKQMPLDVFRQVRLQFPQYTQEQLVLWVERFFRLWSRNQWKRERYAPSFHVDDENLDPKTWCRFPILSGGFERELSELRAALEGSDATGGR